MLDIPRRSVLHAMQQDNSEVCRVLTIKGILSSSGSPGAVRRAHAWPHR